jgi:tetratricopeptide (TPR) repeat protein
LGEHVTGPTEESTTEPSEGSAQPNPAAVATALGRASSHESPAIDREAEAFLRDQRRFTNLQSEHLHEQRELQLTHLRVRRWKDRLSLGLQIFLIVIGTTAALVFLAAAWRAHRDHGLVVDAFKVPPNLAEHGLTGEVVAAHFLDKLQALQSETQSDRPASSYQNNWGEEIRLEIPETGLRWSELERLLTDKLGHVTHVNGEVYQTDKGISLTARLGTIPPRAFFGPQDQIDALTQQAAEAIYRASQPYRFSDYLEQHGRLDEALEVISALASNGPEGERPWAYSKWAMFDIFDRADPAAARAHALLGLGFSTAADVDADIALIGAEVWTGHDEKALEYSRDLDPKAHERSEETTDIFFESNRHISSAWLATLVGDFQSAAAEWQLVTKAPDFNGSRRLSRGLEAMARALNHDPDTALETLAPLEPTEDTTFLQSDAVFAFHALPAYWIAMERGDWSTGLAIAQAADAWLEAHTTQLKVMGLMQRVWIRPLEAVAQAKAGSVAAASALIAASPADCYLCLRARGQISAMAHDWSGAEHWFSEAVHQAPSIPFAYVEWGAVRLAKGDVSGAIEELRSANRVAPRFADPLELWGEALMRNADYKGAIVKFEVADRHAPHWCRNHQRWAEALTHLGREKEARRVQSTVHCPDPVEAGHVPPR